MKKWGLVISIIVGVVVVLGAAAAIFVFLLAAKSPEEVVAATEKKIDEIESVHFTMKSTISVEDQDQDVTMNFSGDIVLPDKFRMTGKMEGAGLGMEIEEIMVDDKLYMKMPMLGDQWMVIPIDAESISEGASSNVNPSDFLDYLKANVKIEDLGDEEVNGKDCYHYAIDIDEEELISLLAKDKDSTSAEKLVKEMYKDADMDLEIWIGKNDNLPYKEKIKMDMISPTKMTMDMTIEFSDFNKKVTIEAPKDAKEYKIPETPEDFNTEEFESTGENAKDRTCKANIRTLEGAVHTYEADHGALPAALANLVPDWLERIPTCPDDGDAYQYDAATGDVSCANGPTTDNPPGDGSDVDHTVQ